MVNVRLSFDGQSMEHQFAPGTTPAQIAGNNYIRDALGLPRDVTALCNGAYSTAPVQNGDHITFQAKPSEKAA